MFKSLKSKLGKKGDGERKEAGRPRLTSPAETLELFPIEQQQSRSGTKRGRTRRKAKKAEINAHYHECILRAERKRISVPLEVSAYVISVIEDARSQTEKQLHKAAVQRYVDRIIATADNTVKPGKHGYLQKLSTFRPGRMKTMEPAALTATRKSGLEKRPPKTVRKLKRRLKRKMTEQRRRSNIC